MKRHIPEILLFASIQAFVLAGLNVGHQQDLVATWLGLVLAQILGALFYALFWESKP